MKPHLIFLLAACMFFLPGCKKDKQKVSDQAKIYLTQEHGRGGSYSIDYGYNAAGQLIILAEKNSLGVTAILYNFGEFTVAGNPARVEVADTYDTDENGYMTIEYDSQNRVAKMSRFYTGGILRYYSIYTYLTNRIELSRHDATGRQIARNIFILNEQGNIASYENYNESNSLAWKVVYTAYDAKKAPTHPLKYLAMVLSESPNPISRNNYTAYETYYYGTLDLKASCTYGYNEYGYPTNRITTDMDSHISFEDFFEYEKR